MIEKAGLLPTLILTTRATALTIVWMGVLICSLLLVVVVVLGTLLRRASWWKIAVGLTVTDLLLAVAAAVLDRLGYGH